MVDEGTPRAGASPTDSRALPPDSVPPVRLVVEAVAEAGRQGFAVQGLVHDRTNPTPFVVLPVGLFRKIAGTGGGGGKWLPDAQLVEETVEGQLSVGTTAVRITAGMTRAMRLFVKPLSSNTGRIYFKVRAGATITTANSCEVPTGGLEIPVLDVDRIYFIASSTSQTLTWSYVPYPDPTDEG